MWIDIVIIQLFAAVVVSDVTPAFSSHGVVTRAIRCQRGAVPLHLRVLQERHDALAVQVIACGQAAEFDQGWVQINQADGAFADLVHCGAAWSGHDQGCARRRFPQGVLAPVLILAEMPPVIAPQNDNGVVGVPALLQCIQQPADMGIDKTDRREVSLDGFAPLVMGDDVGVIATGVCKVPSARWIIDLSGELLPKGGHVVFPDDASLHNIKAWLLATCPDDELRDGTLAIEHANRACELSKWMNVAFVDTLAAAHAEAGDFEAAIEHQQSAVDMAPTEMLGQGIKERLALYKSGQPYHEDLRTELAVLPEGREMLSDSYVDSILDDSSRSTEPEADDAKPDGDKDPVESEYGSEHM